MRRTFLISDASRTGVHHHTGRSLIADDHSDALVDRTTQLKRHMSSKEKDGQDG